MPQPWRLAPPRSSAARGVDSTGVAVPHDAHIVDFDGPERLGGYLRAYGIAAGRQPPGAPRTLLVLTGLAEADVEAARAGAAEAGMVPCVVEDPLDPQRRRVLLPGGRPSFAVFAVGKAMTDAGWSTRLSQLLENDNHRDWTWKLRGRTLQPGRRTLVMGVVNITADSFSDGGEFLDPEQAIVRGLELAKAGADIIDVGAESTRPGATPVERDEEMGRIVPVIQQIALECETPICIDTRRAETAYMALQVGASAVNDISALGDPEMASVVTEQAAGLVVMHMQGTPETMQQNPRYRDLLGEVLARLGEALETADGAGLALEHVAIDPGIGFGKRLEHNLALIEHLGTLRALGRPILVGVSRKSFLGQVTGRDVKDRMPGSLGAGAAAVMRGASILRVHDVAQTIDLVRTLDAVRSGGER